MVASQVGNLHHPQYPGLEDFGDVMLRGNGGTGYIRVDWFTPDGLATWGDGRLTILGTDGFIEIRKNIDIAGRPGGSHLFLVDQKETRYIDCADVALPYGEQLVADVLNRTETAMPQAHCFLAMELVLEGAGAGAARDSRRERRPGAGRHDGGGHDVDVAPGVPGDGGQRAWPPRLSPAFPAIVPASVLGAGAEQRINVGAIGVGRISRVHDMPGVWKYDGARIVAVCDLTAKRLADGEALVNGHYAKQCRHSRTTAWRATPTIASCSPAGTSTRCSSARPTTGTR